MIINGDGIISSPPAPETNFSYPGFTYENLVIPGLALSLDFMAAGESASSLVSNAVISGFRTGLSCKLYDSSHLEIHFYESHDGTNGMSWITLRDIFNPLGGEPRHEANFDMAISPPIQHEGFFGLIATPDARRDIPYTYAWGKFDLTSSTAFTFASGMSCNDTLEAVDIEATFMGASLDIDPSKHSVPVESTARRITHNIP